jgi:YD repeat-containing protein
MKYSFVTISFFLLSLSAHAIVDMRNANYSASWVDLEIPGSGYELKVNRTYNSRSLHNGIFGFGWCSDFETKIDVTPEGNLKLTECGAGQEIYYLPREFSRKEIDKTVGQIVSALRTKKKMDETSLKNLEKDLPTNHNLRAKYAQDLKIAITIKEGTQFFANSKEVENVVFAKGYYTRNIIDGSSQRFAKDGRLTHIYDKNGNFLKFDYDKETLKEVVDNNGRRLNFKFYNNKKIKTITGPNSSVVEYKYENLDDLSYVKNAWGNVYTYIYDDMHNMTKATWPAAKAGEPSTFIALTYNKKNDWVTSFVDRTGCREDYSYEDSPTDPKNHYWSIVKKTCGKEIVTESKYEFWHKTRGDGENYLYRVSSVINGNATEVTYHETFGKPVTIRRNGEVFTFDYYPNGQVKVKSSRVSKFIYEYSKENNKVSLVTAVALNEKGKPTRTLKTSFKYDSKGNLTYASNTDGQSVEMSYDLKGRIATIKDHAKKFVKIQYDEKSGRPGIVSRPGLGTINVSYKPNGEIEKVNSNEGPSVAMQVASTFNNLLEIISPATAEVYN